MGTVGVLSRVAPNILPRGDGVIISLVEEVAHGRKVFPHEVERAGALTMHPKVLYPVLKKIERFEALGFVVTQPESKDPIQCPHVHLNIIAKVDRLVNIIGAILLFGVSPIEISTVSNQLYHFLMIQYLRCPYSYPVRTRLPLNHDSPRSSTSFRPRLSVQLLYVAPQSMIPFLQSRLLAPTPYPLRVQVVAGFGEDVVKSHESMILNVLLEIGDILNSHVWIISRIKFMEVIDRVWMSCSRAHLKTEKPTRLEDSEEFLIQVQSPLASGNVLLADQREHHIIGVVSNHW